MNIIKKTCNIPQGFSKNTSGENPPLCHRPTPTPHPKIVKKAGRNLFDGFFEESLKLQPRIRQARSSVWHIVFIQGLQLLPVEQVIENTFGVAIVPIKYAARMR